MPRGALKAPDKAWLRRSQRPAAMRLRTISGDSPEATAWSQVNTPCWTKPAGRLPGRAKLTTLVVPEEHSLSSVEKDHRQKTAQNWTVLFLSTVVNECRIRRAPGTLLGSEGGASGKERIVKGQSAVSSRHGDPIRLRWPS